MNENQLNVLYSSDDNYAQHMGASICSLLEHNRDFDKINIYVIDNNISSENISRLKSLIDEFENAEIVLIPFEKWKNRLNLNMEWNISLSSYARLFVATMLPNYVGRVLYLDCDMIICGDLHALWNTELQECLLAAVQDSVSAGTKNAIGLSEHNKYFNAGMLLINLELWRQMDTENKCVQFIEEHNGNVRHHDQGVLNGVCKNSVHFLPLKYNLMTIHYIFNREQILHYFNEAAPFYSKEEISEAKESPIILHYTPSFTSRPWVKGCRHPLKQLYWGTLAHTPWAGAKPQRNKAKWYVRLIEWRYRIFKV